MIIKTKKKHTIMLVIITPYADKVIIKYKESDYMKSLRWLMPIAGLLAIGLGMTTLLRPLTSLTTIAIFFGISVLSSGISEIVSFCSAGKGNRSGWMLSTGILSVLFGLWATVGIGMYAIMRFIPFIFAGWTMALGIERIADAVARKYVEYGDGGTVYRRSINKWGLILGILTVLFSIILCSIHSCQHDLSL